MTETAPSPGKEPRLLHESSFYILDHGPNVFDRFLESLRGNAELFAPIANLVILARVNPLPVRAASFVCIARHTSVASSCSFAVVCGERMRHASGRQLAEMERISEAKRNAPTCFHLVNAGQRRDLVRLRHRALNRPGPLHRSSCRAS